METSRPVSEEQLNLFDDLSPEAFDQEVILRQRRLAELEEAETPGFSPAMDRARAGIYKATGPRQD